MMGAVGLSSEAREQLGLLIRAINDNTAAIAAQTQALWSMPPVKPPKPEPCSGDCKAGEQ